MGTVIANCINSFIMQDKGLEAAGLTVYFQTAAAFLDKNYAALVERVQSVMALADVLKSKNMLHEEKYSEIKAETTNHNKMRKLFEALNSGGNVVKEAFYNALREYEPYLFRDLGGDI
ncbi:putative apoptosis-associated speck-like protein containing a CARD [Triplophysa rosa]|uniref:Apoptosis-associated speck-like protein containing a CARD n=1 Tax=Triplophysa rosa TaxID=992332 RepID=A0A9W7WW93_TRIRA|nr:putative apoptosis-associated speck-like protein containing a CARD [Triplophysa rosa]